jgi:hypothetical protein
MTLIAFVRQPCMQIWDRFKNYRVRWSVAKWHAESHQRSASGDKSGAAPALLSTEGILPTKLSPLSVLMPFIGRRNHPNAIKLECITFEKKRRRPATRRFVSFESERERERSFYDERSFSANKIIRLVIVLLSFWVSVEAERTSARERTREPCYLCKTWKGLDLKAHHLALAKGLMLHCIFASSSERWDGMYIWCTAIGSFESGAYLLKSKFARYFCVNYWNCIELFLLFYFLQRRTNCMVENKSLKFHFKIILCG